ncbi:MAG: hypothetical protein ACAF41_10425 [Leptolyngbya sp. BL-A-14]
MLKRFAIAATVALSMGYAAAASAAPLAVTNSPDSETIVGGRSVDLPTPPTTPIYFTLPIELSIVKDPAITTNTPITDSLTSNYAAWGEKIRACALQKPIFVRKVGDAQEPFVVGGSEGTIKLNANDKPVCSV